MQRWGIADDGEVLEVDGPDTAVEVVLAHHAPPCGMRWVDAGVDAGVDEGVDAGADAGVDTRAGRGRIARRVAVDHDADGRIEVRVDGRARPGGVDAAESELALFAAERLHGLVAVHAAVWCLDDGVVVLPGASHCGKSTWSAAAMDAGVTVWSDEFALVDPAGSVRGWPRPLRLRTPSGVVRRPLEPCAAAAATGEPRRAVAIVDVTHTGKLDVRDATESAAIGAVLANTVCARRRPAESFAAAVALVSGARVATGTRGEATAAVEWLLDWVRVGTR